MLTLIYKKIRLLFAAVCQVVLAYSRTVKWPIYCRTNIIKKSKADFTVREIFRKARPFFFRVFLRLILSFCRWVSFKDTLKKKGCRLWKYWKNIKSALLFPMLLGKRAVSSCHAPRSWHVLQTPNTTWRRGGGGEGGGVTNIPCCLFMLRYISIISKYSGRILVSSLFLPRVTVELGVCGTFLETYPGLPYFIIISRIIKTKYVPSRRENEDFNISES